MYPPIQFHSIQQIVLKALNVVHAISIKGGPAFLKSMVRHRKYFNQHHFADNTSSRSVQYSKFIRIYAAYLGLKADTFRSIGLSRT